MGRYRVFIKPSAVREIEGVADKRQRQRIVAKIEALSHDPRPPGCEKLTGREQYRVRQGPYRIVYAIEDDRLVVYVVKVGHRSSVYR
ncbi:MAG: type II toxin-antitoxin system RelE/ParE family toxin [Thermoleophilia bacterium]|nr:type II toxin-antitoxin system RelE/ParE family toxin [Thermoleophilia bacterium]